MYHSIVELIKDMVFGGTVEGTMYGQLICEGFGAVACVLLVAFPFIIAWRMIRRFL